MLITNAADQDANQHKTIMVGGIRKHTLYISNYVQPVAGNLFDCSSNADVSTTSNGESLLQC